MQVKIILGPPGTGKTTTLLNLVDAYLKTGGEPGKIGFISFTKKSVEEAKQRACERFKLIPADFLYFRTIHSLSFRQLTLSSSQVMQRKHYVELGEIIGMNITGIHRQDEAVYEMAKGDQLNFIESLSRLKCENIETTWNDINSDISLEELEYFSEALIKYKNVNMLYDFTDMLVKYYEEGYKPELDLLIVDEAQDLCKLQWKIVGQLAKSSKKTYIAGDDDQAIFRWSGADVDYFMRLSKKYSTDVLSKSYRMPEAVYDLSKNLVSQINDRTIKKFTHTGEKGNVVDVMSLDDVDMSKGEWLVLVRNGFMTRSAIEHVRLLGYPYETTYYSIKEDSAIQAAVIWERLRAGKGVLVEDAKKVLGFMSFKRSAFPALNGKSEEDVITMTEFVRLACLVEATLDNNPVSEMIWHKALDKIPAEDREYYISVLKNGEKLTQKPRIKISTIHGAKGGEADNVVLFTDMSLRTYKNMEDNYDDEIRVFYVGMTRAKKNLYIMQPETLNNFTF